jgi:hypothetical protein
LRRDQDEQARRKAQLEAECLVVKILGLQIEREANAGKVRCPGCPLMVSPEFNAAEHSVVCSVAAERGKEQP